MNGSKQGNRAFCRTCLYDMTKQPYIEINDELTRMLNLIAPELGVVNTTCFINQICFSCHFLLNASYRFKTLCLQTVKRLENFKKQKENTQPVNLSPQISDRNEKDASAEGSSSISVQDTRIIFNDASTLMDHMDKISDNSADKSSCHSNSESILRTLLVKNISKHGLVSDKAIKNKSSSNNEEQCTRTDDDDNDIIFCENGFSRLNEFIDIEELSRNRTRNQNTEVNVESQHNFPFVLSDVRTDCEVPPTGSGGREDHSNRNVVIIDD